MPPALPEDFLIRMKGKNEENTSVLLRRTMGLIKFSYSRSNFTYNDANKHIFYVTTKIDFEILSLMKNVLLLIVPILLKINFNNTLNLIRKS